MNGIIFNFIKMTEHSEADGYRQIRRESSGFNNSAHFTQAQTVPAQTLPGHDGGAKVSIVTSAQVEGQASPPGDATKV